jgi:hypothetical protein
LRVSRRKAWIMRRVRRGRPVGACRHLRRGGPCNSGDAWKRRDLITSTDLATSGSGGSRTEDADPGGSLPCHGSVSARVFLAERLLKEPHARAPLKGLPKRFVMMSTSKGAIDAFRRVSEQTRHWADTPSWTVVVLAVGLAIRLAALTWLAPQPLTDDAVDYHALALALVS